MAATSIDVYAIIFPPPQQVNDPITYTRVPANESYAITISSSSLATLADDETESAGIDGLLYVPTIDSGDACYNASTAYVPANVTRQSDLPAGDYKHLALAPWLGSDCAQKYLVAAQNQPTEGIVFFIPSNSTSTPPNATDTIWAINGHQPESLDYGFSIFAVSGAIGLSLMQASSDYSGNLSSIPHAAQLLREFKIESTDYVRLLMEVRTNADSGSLPSLWIFLLIVLAVLLVVIGVTSLSLHVLQRRRRESLRRRVARGEVNLEMLGVKRLTVPQALLDAMPLYPYGTESTAVAAKGSAKGASVVRSEKGKVTQTTTYRPTPLQQPTCAICLDDFSVASADSAGSTVRELPCHHIFHPECVDAFLRDNSSLCPICKNSALPSGYCPQLVTNAMVRRERMMRRQGPVRGLRAPIVVRSNQDVEAGDHASSNRHASAAAFRSRTRSSLAQLRRLSGMPPRPTSPSPDRQMAELSPPPPSAPDDEPTSPSSARGEPPESSVPSRPQNQNQAPAPAPASAGRREWARQRALSMLGPRQDQVPLDPDALEAATTPRWRKVVRTLFPGAA